LTTTPPWDGDLLSVVSALELKPTIIAFEARA